MKQKRETLRNAQRQQDLNEILKQKRYERIKTRQDASLEKDEVKKFKLGDKYYYYEADVIDKGSYGVVYKGYRVTACSS